MMRLVMPAPAMKSVTVLMVVTKATEMALRMTFVGVVTIVVMNETERDLKACRDVAVTMEVTNPTVLVTLTERAIAIAETNGTENVLRVVLERDTANGNVMLNN